jgi:hypothetical protein
VSRDTGERGIFHYSAALADDWNHSSRHRARRAGGQRETPKRTNVKAKNPIDRRPFRSKADHQTETNLESQYRGVAIPSVIAALELQKIVAAAERQARD